MCTYVYVCTCIYTVFRSFHRNLLVDMFAFIILWSSLGQIYDFVYRINKNYTIIVARRWKENIFRIIEQTANICYWSSEVLRDSQRNNACWDLPCSSCSCRWRTCWRVADRGGVPSHLCELTAFIHLSVTHCFVCQSAESAHTQSLFERVNNECVCVCVWPSAAAVINSSTNNIPVCTFILNLCAVLNRRY